MKLMVISGFIMLVLVAAACGTTETDESEQQQGNTVALSPTPLDECDYVRAVADGIVRLGDAFSTLSDLIDDPFSEEWLTSYNDALEHIREVHGDSLPLTQPPSLSSIHSNWVDITFDANGVADALTLDENLNADPERVRHAIFTVVPDLTDRQLLLIADMVEVAPQCTVSQN